MEHRRCLPRPPPPSPPSPSATSTATDDICHVRRHRRQRRVVHRRIVPPSPDISTDLCSAAMSCPTPSEARRRPTDVVRPIREEGAENFRPLSNDG
nr:hypothetical protein Iba_chr14fCG5640 [Ipomoea batatas]